MIEVQDICKSYGELQVLKDINLNIEEGKTTVLLGQSGCGKSTLLKLILGLIAPDSGRITINGKNLQELDRAKTEENFRHLMGYVVQEGGLFPHLTNEQNLSLVPRYKKMNPSGIQEKISSLTELTKFPRSALKRYPLEVSGGQRQRVSLMRALMMDPDILLMDEPLGALDPIIRYDLQKELKSIFQKLNKTVILVTHDLAEAAYFGDQIALFKEGRIIQRGSVDDLKNNPADVFVNQFIEAQRSFE